MVIEALEGAHPRLLLEQGRRRGVRRPRWPTALTAFAAAFAPRPITYRTIDFRTNEFRGLEGGERFEPEEANPMIGFRGALRYTREPEVFAARAGGDRAGVGRRPREPPRDAAVRAHARAS